MFKKILKQINLRRVIILIVLLIFNSYAWFIYATKVSVGLTAHIEAWDVSFKSKENEIISNAEINVDKIYPGMDEFSETIEVNNDGDRRAKLSYRIKSMTILGTKYEIDENTTEQDMLNRAENEYPFYINIFIDNEILEARTGNANIVITVNWDFESENDAVDTYWGELAYDFYNSNPDESSVHVEIELIATQIT